MQIGQHLLMFLLSQNSFAFLFCHSCNQVLQKFHEDRKEILEIVESQMIFKVLEGWCPKATNTPLALY